MRPTCQEQKSTLTLITQVGRFYRPIKQPVTIRLDADVIAWFKETAPQYQTAVNAVLREYMERTAANDEEVLQKRKKKKSG